MMIGQWMMEEIALFAAGALCVLGSFLLLPWKQWRELLKEPNEHPAVFPARAMTMLGVGLVAGSGVLVSIRQEDHSAALMSAGLLGFATGMLLASWAHIRFIRQLLKKIQQISHNEH